MIRARLIRLLQAPLLTGWPALGCAVAAVALPTIVRAAINGAVTGCEFTPYLPFVLLSAILMRWWQAAAVALASVAVLGGLFLSPADALFDQQCFLSGAGVFLAASAMMIGIAVLVRSAITAFKNRGADGSSGGLIFSLEKGEVWASWNGQSAPVRLGSENGVSRMMKDFLAQVEVGKRLNRRREHQGGLDSCEGLSSGRGGSVGGE